VAETAKKKYSLFSKIETREDAMKAIKDNAGGFFAVAVIQGLIGAFLAPALIIDAVLIAVAAFIMRQWNSRVAAWALLLMSGLILATTVGNRLGMTSQGGGNIFLAALMVWISIRSVKATILVNQRTATPSSAVPTPRVYGRS